MPRTPFLPTVTLARQWPETPEDVCLAVALAKKPSYTLRTMEDVINRRLRKKRKTGPSTGKGHMNHHNDYD